jgi:hypothetical protein
VAMMLLFRCWDSRKIAAGMFGGDGEGRVCNVDEGGGGTRSTRSDGLLPC